MKKKWEFLFKIGILFIIVLSKSSCSTELNTAYFDSKPRYIYENKKWKGICHDIFSYINTKLKKVKIKIPKYMTPLKRIKVTTARTQLDLLGCIDRSISKNNNFEIIEVPLYKVSSVLIMNDKKKYKDMRHLHGKKIGVIRGSRTDLELKGLLSHKSIQEVGSLNSLVFMFERKRIDGIYDNTLDLFYFLSKKKLLFKYRSILKTKHYEHYIAVNKNMPKIVKEKIFSILKNMESEGVLDEIYWKYLGV